GVGGLLAVRRPSNAGGWVLVVIGACHALAALAVAVTLSAVADGPAAAGAAAVAAWWAMVFATIGGLLFALGFIFPTGRGQTPAWDRFVRVFAILLAAFAVFGLFLRPGPLQVYSSIDNPFGFGPDLQPLLGSEPSNAIGASLALILPRLPWSL